MIKKGFTLMELVAAVIIITIISITVTISLKNAYRKSEEKKYAEFKREVEQAACTYIDLTANRDIKSSCFPLGSCSVTVNKLISSGLIGEDLIDPSTDEKVNQNLIVNISWDADSAKKCTLQ